MVNYGKNTKIKRCFLNKFKIFNSCIMFMKNKRSVLTKQLRCAIDRKGV